MFGLQTTCALLNRKFYAVAFGQFTIPFAVDGGVMDENVLSTFTSDEAVAFTAIEPFHSSVNSISHLVASLAKKNM